MSSLVEQIECVDREIRMREKSYPRWVKKNKLTQRLANLELDRMRSVLESLIKLYLDESWDVSSPSWNRVMAIGLAHLGENLDRIVENAS